MSEEGAELFTINRRKKEKVGEMLYRGWGIAIFCAVVIALAAVNPVAVKAADCPDRNSPASQLAGNNEFAFDLYKKIGSEETNTGKNIFFSPYSISTALGMTYAGARGETERQMAAVLHFSPDQAAVHGAFRDLATSVDGTGKSYQLSVGNALWGQQNYPFDSDFLSLISKYYAGGFNTVDFVRETEASRVKINRWVADKTADKIQNLLQQGDISNLTRLVLTNAIYFKSNWATPFEKTMTRPALFKVDAATTREVQMMARTGPLPYVENEQLQAVELPYAGNDLSMLVLLPKTDISVLEQQLSLQQLDELQAQLKPTPVSLYLPRFKFDARYALQDKKYLPAMGMVDAFDERLADFSGLTGNKELFISGVFHKAFIDVNESGTEAAAATAVVVGLKSMPPPSTIFRADHPFVFLIRHQSTGSILFLGRVANPAQ